MNHKCFRNKIINLLHDLNWDIDIGTCYDKVYTIPIQIQSIYIFIELLLLCVDKHYGYDYHQKVINIITTIYKTNNKNKEMLYEYKKILKELTNIIDNFNGSDPTLKLFVDNFVNSKEVSIFIENMLKF